jgi:hypothetical protein
MVKSYEGALFTLEQPRDVNLEFLWHSRARYGYGANLLGFNNPTIDQLIDRYHADRGDAKNKRQTLSQLHQLLSEEQPSLFLAESC